MSQQHNQQTQREGVYLVSDCHFEMDLGDTVWDNSVQGDILLLAGDMYSPAGGGFRKFAKFLRAMSKQFNHVFYVAGNHEFYYGNFLDTPSAIRLEIAGLGLNNVTFLDSNAFTVGDYCIAGVTLWTDYNKNNPIEKLRVEGVMRDYLHIDYSHDSLRKLTADDVLKAHNEQVEFLRGWVDLCNNHYPTKTPLLLSHHCPTTQGMKPVYGREWVSNYWAGYYCTDMDDVLANLNKPYISAFGHIHAPRDFSCNGGRFVSNCRGYNNKNTVPHINLLRIA